MTEPYYSPIAIIELDECDCLQAVNAAAISLFALPDDIIDNIIDNKSTNQNKPFNYRHYFNLPATTKLDDINNSTIVIDQQRYFIQLIKQPQCKLFIIQAIDYLKRQLSLKHIVNQHAFDVFCAHSQVMQQLLKQAKAFSKQHSPLLISGATGSGKDLLALACHQYSPRGDQVFFALNCAAIPDEVVESELYGHASGAYANATEGKKGFFEQANGGSVLLDSIDEMSFRMQTKLLRFINDGSFRRVGDDNEVQVDVRVICSTKVDLYSLVEQGKFREDLYYRLNVLSLHLPSLQERKDDMMDLTRLFVQEFANKQGIAIPTIDRDVELLLKSYPWPGNVRELKNVLYSALAQLNGHTLTASCITLPRSESDDLLLLAGDWSDKTLDEMTKQFEKNILTQLYQTYPSSRKLAKRLGISHTAIANKLREFGIGKSS